MKLPYHQQWLIPLPVADTWQFLASCFTDSAAIKEWPSSLSELKLEGSTLKRGSTVVATYKVGPFHMRARYLIAAWEPERHLSYRTHESHPLEGRSQIHLQPVTGGTQCTWEGYYANKQLAGLLPLFWFKAFFEKIFFFELERRTMNIQTMDPPSRAAAR